MWYFLDAIGCGYRHGASPENYLVLRFYELKDAEKTEELYKYLLTVQCNALNKILPGMFQKIADYTRASSAGQSAS